MLACCCLASFRAASSASNCHPPKGLITGASVASKSLTLRVTRMVAAAREQPVNIALSPTAAMRPHAMGSDATYFAAMKLASGDLRPYCHGFMITRPTPSKSATFRVASAAPREIVMDAIWASNWLIGRPALRLSVAIEP